WLASAGVANNSDDNIKIWDLASGSPELARSLKTGTTDALTVAFSPDGTLLASGGADTRVTFWNVPAWNEAATLPREHAAAILSLAFSPDGKTLASGGADATIQLWDVVARTSLGDPLVGHTNWVWSVAFHPTDGDLLASG